MTLERATPYKAAWADGLFVPGMPNVEDTKHIASQTTLPLNLILLPNMPSIQSLFTVGALRFAAGPATFQTAYGHARMLLQALLVDHSVEALLTNTVTWVAGSYDLPSPSHEKQSANRENRQHDLSTSQGETVYVYRVSGRGRKQQQQILCARWIPSNSRAVVFLFARVAGVGRSKFSSLLEN